MFYMNVGGEATAARKIPAVSDREISENFLAEFRGLGVVLLDSPLRGGRDRLGRVLD